MFPMESLLLSKPDSMRASRRGRSTSVVLHWVSLGHSPKRAFFPLNSKLIFNPPRTAAPSTRHKGNKLNHKTSVWKSNRVLLSVINFEKIWSTSAYRRGQHHKHFYRWLRRSHWCLDATLLLLPWLTGQWAPQYISSSCPHCLSHPPGPSQSRLSAEASSTFLSSSGLSYVSGFVSSFLFTSLLLAPRVVLNSRAVDTLVSLAPALKTQDSRHEPLRQIQIPDFFFRVSIDLGNVRKNSRSLLWLAFHSTSILNTGN